MVQGSRSDQLHMNERHTEVNQLSNHHTAGRPNTRTIPEVQASTTRRRLHTPSWDQASIPERMYAAVRSLKLLIILLTLCLIGTGCSFRAAGTRSMDEKRVALIVRMEQLDYWKTVRMGAEAAAKEFNVKLEVAGPENEEDVDGQVELIDQFLQAGTTDAIIIAANDYKGLSKAVERAHRKGIPMINIDAEAESPYITSFIGINNVEAGRQAGQRLAELLGGTGKVAVVNFGIGPRNGEQRQTGALDILRQYPDLRIAAVEHCASEGASCSELTRELIKQHENLDGILALNAVTTLGVAQEIKELGLAGQVKVVGFDSIPEEIELLQDGVLQATIVQNPFNMGYLGVKHAVMALERRKVPARMELGTKVIDYENMYWIDHQKLLFPFVHE